MVDKTHDEFTASMIAFFPDTVTVHPGQTVHFRQLWTGEPHSVTFGTLFNAELGQIRERLGQSPPPPARELPGLEVIDTLPVMLGRGNDEFAVNQNGAQPCYLDEGKPPTDPDTPCPQRAQPRFTGRETYYSSGFIQYAGARGNLFDLPLADDIAPGSYHFYCNLHGVGQSGTVRVVSEDEALPSASKVARETRNEITQRYSDPLKGALAAAKGGSLVIDGTTYRTPLAGAATDDVRPWGGLAHRRHFGHRHGSVNEFVPSTVRTGVGEPVTWTFVGRHTVSFNVPGYRPVFAVDKEGVVRLDSRVYEPVGWTIPTERPSAGPLTVDAAPWNGKGFRSTGLDWRTGDQFRVAFSKPGTYLMACLIHPGMVGKVIVT
jgi:plastocyanin